MSLFLINLSLLAVALLLNIPWRQWQLVAYYAVLLALFHIMYFDIGASMGGRWYEYCIITQAFMFAGGVFSGSRAGRVVAVAAVFAILANVVKWWDFAHYQLVDHQWYYVAINSLQSVQIGSFIVLTPLWPFLWKRLRRKPQTRSDPWQTRRAVTHL